MSDSEERIATGYGRTNRKHQECATGVGSKGAGHRHWEIAFQMCMLFNVFLAVEAHAALLVQLVPASSVSRRPLPTPPA
jgi:hypothetical protein